jgi:hypothetical protein
MSSVAGRPRIVRPLLGAAAIVAGAACGDDPIRPPAPALVEALVSPALQATVGAPLSPTPTIVVRDAGGEIISGLPVAVTVKEGGGTLAGAPRRTASGATPVGTWTLGRTTGRNVLSVRAGSLAPLEIVVTALPAAPNAMATTQGNAQVAFAGEELAQPLAVAVRDRFGNGVPGQEVSFAVVTGDGALSASTVSTGANGIAGNVRWRLGARGGAQEISASSGTLRTTFTAGIRTEFTPDLRFQGSPPDAGIHAAFSAARERIRATVIGDLPDVVLQNFDLSRCGLPGGTLSETIDDVVILAAVTTIDGPGKVLGAAGPCLSRTLSGHAVVGVMRFDVDDLTGLTNSGRLGAVILHEMLHVIGVGTLWRSKDLLFGSGTQDPRFSGALGAFRCMTSGGSMVCADSRIPVENTGAPGTIEAHWRESVFDTELMTGVAELNPNMPFSAMTIASLEDLGLTANYLTADPYFVPTVSLRVGPGSTILAPAPPWEILELPRFEVTPAGWVRPVAWK